MITLLFICLTIPLIILLAYLYKVSKVMRRIKTKGKLNINSWMRMTRAERYAIDEEEKKDSFKRKKMLLNQIRKEYKNLSQSKHK